MAITSYTIWIDENIDNEENTKYLKELESIGLLNYRLFKEINKAINHMKYIEFKETKVIISGRLYSEFVNKFKENIIDMCVAPKIIIFTSNKEKFIKNNKEYQEDANVFYKFGGIATAFNEIKKFLKDDIIPQKIKKPDDIQVTFEYIDSIEKLELPIFFKFLIDSASINNMDEYTNSLYNTYSKDNKELKILLGSIKSMTNIPIELLSKYYARLYTIESNFYKDINKDLKLNIKEKYLPFIKTLYEGVKLKSLSLASNNILYRGAKISNEEITKIKSFLKKKIKNLPGAIAFSKSFLSFSKDKKVAEKFLNYKNDNNNLSKVLFIIEKDDNIGYNLSTHGDIEKISFFPSEKEVLFFPFSSFEIKEIKEINIGKEKGYEIKLLYLGKYLKEIENNKNIINKENKIPDSEFKKQLCEFCLIKEEKIKDINIKILYKEYKKYEKEIEENNKKNNIIIGEINISSNDIIKSDEFKNLNRNEMLNKLKLKKLKKIQTDVMHGCGLTLNQLDSRGNKVEGWREGENRGGKPYYPPRGWIGIGLKVIDKYEDNIWIGRENKEGEWCVAYHGVASHVGPEEVKKIIGIIYKTTFKSGLGQVFEYDDDIFHPGKKVGKGVHCTPIIEVAEQYAGISIINGIKYKTVLMNRVKPDAIRCPKKEIYYWVVNGTTDEIRPYRILYKEVDS